jgi:citrate lyase subunit beta/citryl-CoA lyase
LRAINEGSTLRSILVFPLPAAFPADEALRRRADAILVEFEPDEAAARSAALDFFARARAQADPPRLFIKAPSAEDSGLEAVFAALAPDGLVLEAANGRAAVQRLSSRLAVLEAQAGLADGATRILALAAQTPAAAVGLGTYAGASPRLVGLAFGGGRLPGRRHGAPRRLARTLLVLGAAAAGVAAIDEASAKGGAGTGFAKLCEAARRDGFTGKFAVSPAQVEIVNAVFGERR